MRRIALLAFAAASAACVTVAVPLPDGRADDQGPPAYGIKIPPGYRDWRLISVAHEEGKLSDLRAILGNGR
jgi:hypothetical protein